GVADLPGGGGRSRTVRQVQVGGRLLRPDAQALPVGRGGRDRRHHARRRRIRAHGAARRGQRVADARDPVQHAQALGGGRRQAAGHAEGQGGVGAQARHRAPPDLGRRDGVPLGSGPGGGGGI
ncbi:MAG: Mobile element protein, partial [uncultured Acetobacteraceae bacterium]